MTSRENEQRTLGTASLVVLAVVALGFVLWFTRTVAIPFVLASFVVAVVTPLADFLELRARFSRWLSVATMLVVVMFATAMFVLLLFYMARSVYSSVDQYASHFSAMSYFLLRSEDDAKASEPAPPLPGDDDIVAPEPDAVLSGDGEAPGDLAFLPVDTNDDKAWKLFSRENIRLLVDTLIGETKLWLVRTARGLFGSAVNIISAFVMMNIFVLFLLAGRDPRKLKQGVYGEIETKIRHYLSIKTAVSAVTGCLVGTILSLLGLQLAVTFGVFAFILNFIPSLGSIVATFLPLPIAYAQFVATVDEPQWWRVVAVLALPGLVQVLIGNVLEPRILGQRLELHPVVILFALVFWTLLWGPIGAILAVPITAVIRIALSQFNSLRPAADVMIGKLPAPP